MKFEHGSTIKMAVAGACIATLSACAGTPSGGGEEAPGYVIGYDDEPAIDYLDTCVESYLWEEDDRNKECDPEMFAEKEPESEPAEQAEPEPEPRMVREVVTLDSATLFAFDSAELRQSGVAAIRDLANDVNELNSVNRISVAGHTDSVGPAEYNEGLSKRRAQSVVDQLVEEGINRDRIRMQWYGEENPVASNETEEGRAKNRRVVITIEGTELQRVDR